MNIFILCLIILSFILKLEDLPEINDGKEKFYKIIVKTSDKQGSGTTADIQLQLFGKIGKSKLITLKNSVTNKIQFAQSKTDVFEYRISDVGKIKAIKIGHNEHDIGNSTIILNEIKLAKKVIFLK